MVIVFQSCVSEGVCSPPNKSESCPIDTSFHNVYNFLSLCIITVFITTHAVTRHAIIIFLTSFHNSTFCTARKKHLLMEHRMELLRTAHLSFVLNEKTDKIIQILLEELHSYGIIWTMSLSQTSMYVVQEHKPEQIKSESLTKSRNQLFSISLYTILKRN